MNYLNIEEMHTILRGASRSKGAKYDVIQKWFEKCRIVDGRHMNVELFSASYERLCPNMEEIGLAQFIQLLGILSRHTRVDVKDYVRRFNTVKQDIIDEIKESILENKDSYYDS